MRAVWSDFGGVLTAPATQLLTAFSEKAGIEPEAFVTATWAVARQFGTDDPMEPLDTPLVDEPRWCAMVEHELRSRFGVSADISGFGARWLECDAPDDQWLEYLRSLRDRGCFVGLLSNMMPGFEPHWRRLVPIGEVFDDLVLSHEVGLRKPQLEIFELARRRAGVDPGDCVLIDDLEPNCAAARAAGWAAVRFTGAAQAIAETERCLEGVSTDASSASISSPESSFPNQAT